MSLQKYTCLECGYEYSTLTGKQQEECPECGNTEWKSEVIER